MFAKIIKISPKFHQNFIQNFKNFHLRIDLGKMNLLDDVLAVMDKHLETSNKHTDRNSLGKLKIQRHKKSQKNEKIKILIFFLEI